MMSGGDGNGAVEAVITVVVVSCIVDVTVVVVCVVGEATDKALSHAHNSNKHNIITAATRFTVIPPFFYSITHISPLHNLPSRFS